VDGSAGSSLIKVLLNLSDSRVKMLVVACCWGWAAAVIFMEERRRVEEDPFNDVEEAVGSK
jgi:hypothetical protein